MRFILSCLSLIAAVMVLPSCAPQSMSLSSSPLSFTTPSQSFLDEAGRLPLLDIGRGISKGRVDIYDPWLDKFVVTPPERTQRELDIFPPNRNLYVRDKDVRVFSLASDEVADDLEIDFDNLLTSLDSDMPLSLIGIESVESEALLP